MEQAQARTGRAVEATEGKVEMEMEMEGGATEDKMESDCMAEKPPKSFGPRQGRQWLQWLEWLTGPYTRMVLHGNNEYSHRWPLHAAVAQTETQAADIGRFEERNHGDPGADKDMYGFIPLHTLLLCNRVLAERTELVERLVQLNPQAVHGSFNKEFFMIQFAVLNPALRVAVLRALYPATRGTLRADLAREALKAFFCGPALRTLPAEEADSILAFLAVEEALVLSTDMTILHHAVRNPHVRRPQLELLRSRDRAVHGPMYRRAAHDGDNMIPIHYAFTGTEEPSRDTVEWLLEAWPESAAQTAGQERVLLHFAASNPRISVSLLERVKHANPEAIHAGGTRGCFPIHILLQCHQHLTEALVRVLVSPQEAERTLALAVGSSPLYDLHEGDLRLHVAARNPTLPLEVLRYLTKTYAHAASVANTADGKCLPLHLLLVHHSAPDIFLVDCMVRANPRALRAMWTSNPSFRMNRPDRGYPLTYAVARAGMPLHVIGLLYSTWPEAAADPECSPLHVMLQYNNAVDLPLLQCVLQMDLDALSRALRGGQLPLHLALQYDAPLDVVAKLLELHPASASRTVANGRLLLHFLLSRGNKRGIGDRIVDSSPAAILGTIDALLQEHPAAVEAPDSAGNLPLHVAAANPVMDPEVLNRIIDCFPQAVAQANKKGERPLHCMFGATGELNRSRVEVLLRADPSALTATNANLETPMHRVMINHDSLDLPTLQLLLQHSSATQALQQQDSRNFLPLHHLLRREDGTQEADPEVFAALVKHVLDSTEEDAIKHSINRGIPSPVHLAAMHSHTPLQLLKLLYKHDHDKQLPSAESREPLMHVVLRRCSRVTTELMKWLVKVTPRRVLSVRDRKGQTPLEIAEGRRRHKQHIVDEEALRILTAATHSGMGVTVAGGNSGADWRREKPSRQLHEANYAHRALDIIGQALAQLVRQVCAQHGFSEPSRGIGGASYDTYYCARHILADKHMAAYVEKVKDAGLNADDLRSVCQGVIDLRNRLFHNRDRGAVDIAAIFSQLKDLLLLLSISGVTEALPRFRALVKQFQAGDTGDTRCDSSDPPSFSVPVEAVRLPKLNAEGPNEQETEIVWWPQEKEPLDYVHVFLDAAAEALCHLIDDNSAGLGLERPEDPEATEDVAGDRHSRDLKQMIEYLRVAQSNRVALLASEIDRTEPELHAQLQMLLVRRNEFAHQTLPREWDGCIAIVREVAGCAAVLVRASGIAALREHVADWQTVFDTHMAQRRERWIRRERLVRHLVLLCGQQVREAQAWAGDKRSGKAEKARFKRFYDLVHALVAVAADELALRFNEKIPPIGAREPGSKIAEEARHLERDGTVVETLRNKLNLVVQDDSLHWLVVSDDDRHDGARCSLFACSRLGEDWLPRTTASLLHELSNCGACDGLASKIVAALSHDGSDVPQEEVQRCVETPWESLKHELVRGVSSEDELSSVQERLRAAGLKTEQNEHAIRDGINLLEDLSTWSCAGNGGANDNEEGLACSTTGAAGGAGESKSCEPGAA